MSDGEGSLKQQAAQQARWTTMSSLVNVVLQLAQVAILARLLDKADFGVMGKAWVFIALALMFEDGGLTLAVVHKQKSSRQVLSTLFWTNWVVGIVLFGVLQAAAPLVVEWMQTDRPEDLLSVFRWTSVFFLVSPVGQLFVAVMWRDLRFRDIAVVEIGAVSVGLASAVVGAVSGLGVFALAVGHIGRSVAYTVLAALLGARRFWPMFHFRRAELATFLSFGGFQLADRVSLYGVRNFDKLLVGRWFSDSLQGIYQQAWALMFRLVTAINPIMTRITTALFAKIQDDDERLRRGYLQLVQMQLLIMAPVALGMLAVAGPLVRVYLGPGWSETVDVLRSMTPLVLFFSLRNGCGSILAAKGKMHVAFQLNLAAAVLSVPAVFVGWSYGLPGIALGLSVAQLLVFPFQVWHLRRLIGLSPWRYVGAAMPFLANATVMALAVYGLDRALGWTPETMAAGPAVGHLVLLIGVGGAVYAALVLTLQRGFAREVLSIARGRRTPG